MRLSKFIKDYKEDNPKSIVDYYSVLYTYLDWDITSIEFNIEKIKQLLKDAIKTSKLSLSALPFVIENYNFIDELQQTIELLQDIKVMSIEDERTEASLSAHILNRIG
jgi:hypothetical protein